MTQDPTLINLLEQYRNMRTPPEVESSDTSIATLLQCLRAKAKSIPLKTVEIGDRFIQRLEVEEQTEFKTVISNTMVSYIQSLKTQHSILRNLIQLGEIVEREREPRPEARRHREVWWFVARAVLTQAGQDV